MHVVISKIDLLIVHTYRIIELGIAHLPNKHEAAFYPSIRLVPCVTFAARLSHPANGIRQVLNDFRALVGGKLLIPIRQQCTRPCVRASAWAALLFALRLQRPICVHTPFAMRTREPVAIRPHLIEHKILLIHVWMWINDTAKSLLIIVKPATTHANKLANIKNNMCLMI